MSSQPVLSVNEIKTTKIQRIRLLSVAEEDFLYFVNSLCNKMLSLSMKPDVAIVDARKALCDQLRGEIAFFVDEAGVSITKSNVIHTCCDKLCIDFVEVLLENIPQQETVAALNGCDLSLGRNEKNGGHQDVSIWHDRCPDYFGEQPPAVERQGNGAHFLPDRKKSASVVLR